MKLEALNLILCASLVSGLTLQDFGFNKILKNLLPGSKTLPFGLQAPLVDNERMDAHANTHDANEPGSSGDVVLYDVLPGQSNIRIFSGLTLGVESVSTRLNSSSLNSTILAPLNSELLKLPKKPWESQQDYQVLGSGAYEGQSGEDRARLNMKRFVESHVVTASPLKEGSKCKTMSGDEVWFETKDGKKYVQPANIEVTAISESVANGEVWTLNGVIGQS